MQYTANYHLPTWSEDDRIQMADFNDMTAKIDGGIAQVAAVQAQQGQTVSQHTQTINQHTQTINQHTQSINQQAQTIGQHAQTLSQQAQAINLRGNCRVVTGTYVGNGRYSGADGYRTTLSFTEKPLLVLVFSTDGFVLNLPADCTKAVYVRETDRMTLFSSVTWTASSVSWGGGGAQGQMNISGQTYTYLMFLPPRC